MGLRKITVLVFSVWLAAGTVLPAAAAPSGPLAPARGGPLAQVIEGAKKEGTVTAKLQSSFTQKSMYRLEKEIKEKYGVDLQIKFLPTLKMSTALAEAIMEQNAGVAPTCDVLTFSSHVAQANKAGVIEKIDWKPLLMEGTNPEVVLDTPHVLGGITYFTGHYGLMYNPEKIKPSEVPKTFEELAHPKWKGKGGVETTANSYVRWSFVLGKDKMLSSLRAVLKNGAIQGAYVDLLNRYLLGELWWCTINSTFFKEAQDKGMPAAWQSLDFADISDFASVVRKGTLHPNAARLIALYLASPAGAKFTLEEARTGSLYYPGNYEGDIRALNKKQAIREVFTTRKQDILEFYDSKEANQWEKEIALILQTGGGR